jgi:glucuronate isomerase
MSVAMFIHDDFLLQNEPARRLYHEFAADQPILDYHSHLPPSQIADNRRFADLFEIWLAGDHYKWRAMRAAGIDERFCTGDASAKDKFLSWARIVPRLLGNPLYHWTHLEQKRYFDVDELLDASTAESIWERAKQQLRSEALSTHGILSRFNVRCVCTTDDPVDDLTDHRRIAESGLATRVFPTYRPDAALAVHDAPRFNDWTDRLANVVNCEIGSLDALVDALKARHDAFHVVGCRLSDHGLPYCYATFPSEREANRIFAGVRNGQSADPEQHQRFASYLMLHFARWDTERGWTKQLHLGAIRDNNQIRLGALGPDTGFDSVGDWPQAVALSKFLSQCEAENALPRVVLYNSNPVDNYVFATMAGNFHHGTFPSKIQFGSGWWHADQKDGIEHQIRVLSNVGLLSGFIGMLTDSRSFMSFPRHEYFRRVLCNLLGERMDRGELPLDFGLVGGLVERVCYQNASEYLRLDI